MIQLLFTVTMFYLTFNSNYNMNRFHKSIDPDEQKNNGAGLEQYAFAVLCGEVLNNKTSKNIYIVIFFQIFL